MDQQQLGEETVRVSRAQRIEQHAKRLINEINRRLDHEDNPAMKYGTPWREVRLLQEAIRVRA